MTSNRQDFAPRDAENRKLAASRSRRLDCHYPGNFWDRGCCADDEGTRIGYIALSRAGKKQLKRDLEFSRARGFRPRKVMVGERTVWYLCGHVCGYEFTRGKYSYGVFGIYYAESERAVEKDMRRVLKALEPVDDPAT